MGYLVEMPGLLDSILVPGYLWLPALHFDQAALPACLPVHPLTFTGILFHTGMFLALFVWASQQFGWRMGQWRPSSFCLTGLGGDRPLLCAVMPTPEHLGCKLTWFWEGDSAPGHIIFLEHFFFFCILVFPLFLLS